MINKIEFRPQMIFLQQLAELESSIIANASQDQEEVKLALFVLEIIQPSDPVRVPKHQII